MSAEPNVVTLTVRICTLCLGGAEGECHVRTGFGHPETALWRQMHRAVRELRPRYVLVENVADLLSLHDGECFGEVLGGLAALGYDAEWDCFPAAAFGAPHGRDRVFVTAAADADGELRQAGGAASEQERAGRAALRGGAGAAPNSRSGGWGTGERDLRPWRGEPDAAWRDAAPPDADGWRKHDLREGEDREADERASARRAELRVGGSAEAPADADLGLVPAGRHGGRADGDQTRAETAADAERCGWDGREDQPREDSPDGQTGERRQSADQPARSGDVPALDWGDYELAVRRWETILGRPSPQPLIRRVDDGRARRVERARLSALGDGVLVQAGWLVGMRLMRYDAERRAV